MQMLENAAEQGTRPEMDAAELSKVRRKERLKSRGRDDAVENPASRANVAAAQEYRPARWNARLRYTVAFIMSK